LSARNGHEEITFAIPAMVFGKPPYNLKVMSTTIIESMEKDGYKVKHLWEGDPRHLFISWKTSSNNNNNKTNALKNLAEMNNQIRSGKK
jgi:hypothetical protein